MRAQKAVRAVHVKYMAVRPAWSSPSSRNLCVCACWSGNWPIRQHRGSQRPALPDCGLAPAQVAMRTLHDYVLDEAPAGQSSAPAFVLGPLPLPSDRAGGDKAVEDRFAHAAQRKRLKKRGGAAQHVQTHDAPQCRVEEQELTDADTGLAAAASESAGLEACRLQAGTEGASASVIDRVSDEWVSLGAADVASVGAQQDSTAAHLPPAGIDEAAMHRAREDLRPAAWPDGRTQTDLISV